MQPWKLLAAIGIAFLAGTVGAVFTRTSVPQRYAKLRKPWFTPPNWAFAIWNLLYLLMGIALYRVWSRGFGKPEVRSAMVNRGVHQALNAFRSLLFFGLLFTEFGLIGSLLLWGSITATIWKFLRIDRLSGLLRSNSPLSSRAGSGI